MLLLNVSVAKPQLVTLCVGARHGRLKFTVVSEPMDDDEECVDVGHAFLDLRELLLTGNDVIEQEIDSRCSIRLLEPYFSTVK